MGRGLTERQKYDRTRRVLIKVERFARTLPSVSEVHRHGGQHVAIHQAEPHRPDVVFVNMRWGNMSNGESVGLLAIRGKIDIGGYKDRIREALGIEDDAQVGP